MKRLAELVKALDNRPNWLVALAIITAAVVQLVPVIIGAFLVL